MTIFRMLPLNYADSCTVSASPSVLATLPEQNLIVPERYATMRSSSLAAQSVTFVLPSAISLTMAALGRINLTSAGTIRVQCYTDAAATVAASGGDSTALPAFSVAALDAVDLAKYLTARFLGNKNFIWYPAAAVTGVRAVKYTLDDAANPAGFLEAARAGFGGYFEAAYQIETMGGASIALDTKTSQRRSEFGSLVSDLSASWKTLKISPEKMQIGTDLAAFLAIARDLGKHQDFFFDLFPGVDSAEAIYYRGSYKFTSLAAIEPNDYRFRKSSFTLEEA